MTNHKETIYIDVDDEITTIIDKVKSSDGKIVALVLPKRATVLQSIVNMKLLKKAASSHKKSLVLITSEAGLMPLAGAVGLHVAKSLQSKPAIPSLPDHDDAAETVIHESDEEPAAKTPRQSAVVKDTDETETIELSDTVGGSVAATGKKLAKRFKVPDFDKFRLSFFLGILGVLALVVGWFFFAVVLPRATVTIVTDTSTIATNLTFTASTRQKKLDIKKAVVPAEIKKVKKTDSEKVDATGTKDKGKKADGDITLSIPCTSVSGSPPTIPANTRVSTSSLGYLTNQAISLTQTAFSPCRFYGTGTVTAESGGEQYNIAAGKNFTVSGYPSVTGSNPDTFKGGTTKVVKVVSQADIDEAVDKMKGRLDQEATEELKALLAKDDLMVLEDTRIISSPVVKSKPAVKTETEGQVTVTTETTYTILGVKPAHLSELVNKDAEGQIEAGKQSILDDGLESAAIRLEARKSDAVAQLNLQSLVVAGPVINEAEIKEQIRGKKRGDGERIIASLPGVQDVVIEYKPFWVMSTPRAAKKITIIIEKPATEQTQDTTEGNE